MTSEAHAARPLVSVLMPVHDASRFLRQAVESVLGQTYERFELVAVDDGSKDDSLAILHEYAAKDPRVRPVANPVNVGISRTRNIAIASASPDAKYFAILDSDDVCTPDRIALQVAFLEANPTHALVGGHNIAIDEAGNEIGRRIYPTMNAQIRRVITRYNPFSQPSVMMRRTALEAVGGYDEGYRRCEDYDLWIRLSERFEVGNLDAFVLRYRLSTTQTKQTSLRETLKTTLELQRRWLFHPKFFRPENVAYWAACHALLFVPERLVLELFKHAAYR